MYRLHVAPTRGLLALALASLAGCDAGGGAKSPYPQLTVTGLVLDVRGDAPVAGARVLVWNAFDTGGADTAADGSFSLAVDGSDDPSWIRVTHAGFRRHETTLTVNAALHAAGTRRIVSRDEVLFATLGGDIHMVRAGGDGSLLPVATSGDFETSPARSESGLVVRWANTSLRQVVEASWDGSGARATWTAPAGTSLIGLSWAPRATFVWTNTGGTDGIAMAEDPSGTTFSYSWGGITPDASPPAFGYLGPQPIAGNMLAFSGGDGLYTAFPYFTSSFLVPEKIPGLPATAYRPRWSPLRADGTLDLAYLDGSNDVYETRVSAGNRTNVWSAPVAVYGTGASAVRISDLGWAPETVGQPDRLALVVHPISAGGTDFAEGDLVVLAWDNLAKMPVGTPTLLYDATGAGNVGRAASVSWR
jgi:hypothetical protein